MTSFVLAATVMHGAAVLSLIKLITTVLVVGVAFNMNTAVELTKRIYKKGLDEILFKEIPLYGLIKKWTGMGGEGEFMTWKFSPGGGASNSFANAQQNKGVPGLKRPFITRTKEYALASLDGEFMDATATDAFAVAQAFKVAMDGALYNIQRNIGFSAYRNGGGARAQLKSATSGVGTATITLSPTSSMQGFEQGMWVQASATDGTSGSVLAGKVQISAINYISKTLTTAGGNWNAQIPGITDSYYLFRDGDFGAAVKGLQAWLPDADPTPGDNFFGIDRSSFPEKLAGIRYAPSTGTIQEVLVNASSLALDFGAKPDICMVNPVDFGNLVNEVGSKATIPVPSTKPGVGYEGIDVYGASGRFTVIPDPGCQRYKAWLLTKDTWELWSVRDVPRILNRDGNTSLREANADADELRVGGYLQMVCTSPGHNMNITLPTAS